MGKQSQEVVEWRRLELLHSGFPPRLAARIARDERYELHDLIELVEHGCPPSLTVQILLPRGRNDRLDPMAAELPPLR